MGLSGFSAAEAAGITPPSVNGLQHFFDCFGAMVHDGAAHQQYCSPGSAVPSNSSLGSFSGGALTCHYYSSLTRPLFKNYDVASLGPRADAPPSSALAPELLAGPAPGPCGYCGWLADTSPQFAPVKVASLDPEIGLPMPLGAPQRHTLMTAC
jgi:hypothetical protein